MMRFHYVIKLIGCLLQNAMTRRSKFALSSHRKQSSASLSGYGRLTKTYSNLFYGADYDTIGFKELK